MKVEQRTVYVSDEGEVFESEQECRQFELYCCFCEDYSWLGMSNSEFDRLHTWFKDNT